MSSDLALNPLTWDLEFTSGETLATVGQAKEVAQRTGIRLRRQLSEWFLNTTVGIPWYTMNGVSGILGSKDADTASLLIRREILDTVGIQTITSVNTLWDAGTRSLSVYASALTTYAVDVEIAASIG